MSGTAAAVSSTEVPTGFSLTTELFLIAIDPATGRLVKRRRRRFRKALAGSYGAFGPGAAARARRSALGELRAAGLVGRSLLPGHYPLIPGSGASTPFARLRRCIVYEGLRSPRDVELFVLLAWSGVLAHRLSRSERTRAQRRLRALFAPPPSQDPPSRRSRRSRQRSGRWRSGGGDGSRVGDGQRSAQRRPDHLRRRRQRWRARAPVPAPAAVKVAAEATEAEAEAAATSSSTRAALTSKQPRLAITNEVGPPSLLLSPVCERDVDATSCLPAVARPDSEPHGLLLSRGVTRLALRQTHARGLERMVDDCTSRL